MGKRRELNAGRCGLALAVVALLLPASAAALTRLAAFDTGSASWRVHQAPGPATDPAGYHASGGHPGGYIEFIDADSGSGENRGVFRAPGSWRGNWARAYGQKLGFDLKDNKATTVRIELSVTGGPDSTEMVATLEEPTTDWRRHSIRLAEANWLDTSTGLAATRADFNDLLSDVRDFAIIADLSSDAGEKTGLDNVAVTFDRAISLKLSGHPKRFRGRLTAKLSSCVSNELVTLRRVRPGRDRVVGHGRTSAAGRYSIKGSGRPGRYYARAKPSSGKSGRCASATSSKVRRR